jgi:hypothetical protein
MASWRDAAEEVGACAATAAATTTTAATAATATGAEAAATGESQPDVQCHGDVYAEHGPARTDL